MGEVYHLVRTFHADLETSKVGGHSLVEGDALGLEFSLEVVDARFVRLEVQQANSVVFSASSETSNHTLSDVVCSVDHDKLHWLLQYFS